MISNLRITHIGNFELRLHHLLIIGILATSFSISFLVRAQPAQYGYELNEFDPFFNYRGIQYMVDNGLEAYYAWDDDLAWYPRGRDMSATSQTSLHLTAASTYFIFGGSSSLYDYLVLFPAVIGSLTTIIIFALVRVVGGTTAGLYASLFFALSSPVIVRGTIGWLKSEPMGLFYGLLAIYLFLSGIKTENKKIAAAKLIGGGILLGFALGSWGGTQFFIMPLGMFFLLLPILRKDINFLLWAVPVFTASFIFGVSLFERPGIDFVLGPGGLVLIGPTAYIVASVFIQKISREEARLRNAIILLMGVLASGISLIILNTVFEFFTVSFRYLSAINPFLQGHDAFTSSVAEHAQATTAQFFFSSSILMIFAGIGVWLIFKNKKLQNHYLTSKDLVAFVLVFGILGAYISSSFIRLEIFMSLSVIILSSIGLSILTFEILKPTEKPLQPKKTKKFKKPLQSNPLLMKISFVVIVVTLLITPTILPVQGNWVNHFDAPPTLLNGGTFFKIAVQDWPNALDWIKNNTPQDAVIAAWWDYGYWITTLGERASLADNGTIHGDRIKELAAMLISEPDEAWRILNELDADYILLFVAANYFQTNPPAYILDGGADESKKYWFMRISEAPLEKYLHADGRSGTPYFWQETLTGQLIPYSLLTYVNFNTGEQTPTFKPGSVGVFDKDIKYPADGDGPFKLAYISDTYNRNTTGPVTAVVIYEINKNYTASSELN